MKAVTPMPHIHYLVRRLWFVTQVKFAFFKNNNEVAFVIFDATGSDRSNWFEHSRVIQSSWAIKSDTFSVFSITGWVLMQLLFLSKSFDSVLPSENGILKAFNNQHMKIMLLLSFNMFSLKAWQFWDKINRFFCVSIFT